MSGELPPNLKTIRFAGELLPTWAQLLDVAARLCPVSADVRHWFCGFTACAGVADSRTVIENCSRLRESIPEQQASLEAELRRGGSDTQPSQMIAGWMYALDTMIEQAQSSDTCSWTVEGSGDILPDDSEGGRYFPQARMMRASRGPLFAPVVYVA